MLVHYFLILSQLLAHACLGRQGKGGERKGEGGDLGDLLAVRLAYPRTVLAISSLVLA